jgi:hypothetical protein
MLNDIIKENRESNKKLYNKIKKFENKLNYIKIQK